MEMGIDYQQHHGDKSEEQDSGAGGSPLFEERRQTAHLRCPVSGAAGAATKEAKTSTEIKNKAEKETEAAEAAETAATAAPTVKRSGPAIGLLCFFSRIFTSLFDQSRGITLLRYLRYDRNWQKSQDLLAGED
jgi:hypothetical protein